MDRFMFMKKSCLPQPGAIYMYMIIRFKHLRNHLANQTLLGALLGRGNESLYKWPRSHAQGGHRDYK